MSGPTIQIPGFALLRQCGQGASSQVWLGKDPHGIMRAVRILPKTADAPAAQEEKRIACYRNCAGSHPHLLDFIYTGETAECYYYVSDAADNARQSCISLAYEPDTLHYRNLNSGFTSREIVQYVREILAGLEHLHRSGLAHNDLKPENIIFIRKTLKLADPGLIQPAQHKISGGTAGFRPDWESTGVEADIYALGKIIYCMISGSSTPDFFPVLPQMQFDKFLTELNDIALRCCEKDHRLRYRNCAQIRMSLLALQKKYEPSGRKVFPGLLFLCIIQMFFLILSLLCNGLLYQQKMDLKKKIRDHFPVYQIKQISRGYDLRTVPWNKNTHFHGNF